MALRDAGYAGRISAWTPGGRGPQEGVRRGIADAAPSDVRAALDGASLVILAGPPLAVAGALVALGGPLRDALADAALVTDVASTKGAIGAAARAAGVRHVGGHPMAGRETTGVESGTADLFVDRPWVIVRGDDSTDDEVARVMALARATGARPVELSAEAHDAAVAAISHLPLVVSAALVESVIGSPDWGTARTLAASGWRDMTRLAKGDPEMGAGIVATNADALAARLGALRDVLDDWILRLGSEPGQTGNADEIRERLQRARAALEPEDAP
jgi:prephenate dehydrogenase